ncbi:S8/S53 family peptidase [Flindersiella endophytica]
MRVRPLAALVAVLATVAAVGTAAAAPPPARATPAARQAESHAVTLITGDVVTVSAAPGRLPNVSVRPGPGRERIGFQERRTSTSVRIVPSDAGPLLAAGRLDERLFDVTGLIEQRYDDAHRKDLPLIIGYTGRSGANTTKTKQRLTDAGAQVTRDLGSVRGSVTRTPKARSATFWRSLRDDPNGVGKIWLDGRVEASLDQSVPQIGAPDAWRAGYTGKGVKVAVLDTGIDATHPDLADAVLEAKDFTGSPSGTQDKVGHGTHVSSIVTGSGAASGGRYQGVAPDAQILAGKVLGDDGYGYDSQIISGMEWAASEGARVVNLSLGGPDQAGINPMEEAVNRLTERTGALFVIASGNDGPHSVSSPGSADAALTVGAVDKSDQLAEFSSTGPRFGDHAIKPDVTAPGVDIAAARASGTSMGEVMDDHYTRASGTSMATPHVAGAAAVLLEQHPDWTAAQLKPFLMSTATPNPELGPFQQGTGRVDLGQAIATTVYPDQGSISLFNRWPHEAELSRTVSYRNDGEQPVTLELSVTLEGASVEPEQLTVPAHATGAATLHVDGAHAGIGDITGALTATFAGGDIAARIPVNVYSEPESYDVTATVLDRNGKDISDGTLPVQLMNLETLATVNTSLTDGKLVARVPKGTYELLTVVETAGAGEVPVSASLMTIPDLAVDRDQRLTLDARTARRVTAKTDSRSAVPAGAGLSIIETFGDEVLLQGWSSQYGVGRNAELYATPTEPVTSRAYEFGYHATLTETRPVAKGSRLPASYHLLFREPGRIPERLTFRADPGNLAVVDTHLHAQGVPADAYRLDTPWLVRGESFVPLIDVAQATRVPEHRTEYYSTAGDLAWNLRFDHAVDGSDTTYEEVDLPADGRFAPGRRYRVDANQAAVSTWVLWTYRDGERVHFSALPGAPSSTGFAYGLWDEAGHTGRATLSRDGVVIGSSDDPLHTEFPIPSGAATYALRQTVDRDVVWSNLATRSDTTWTFRWNGDSSEWIQFFTTMSPRISGGFDDLNRAPAGQTFPLEVTAQWYGADSTQDAPRIEHVTLATSYDDGATWHEIPFQHDGNTWRGIATHPPKGVGTGFVSLRTSLVDSGGNRIDQTVIRAYQLR